MGYSLHTSSVEMLPNVPSELGNQFLSVLESTDPKLSISECSCLVLQAVLTLNYFHNSRENPKLSYYAYLLMNRHGKAAAGDNCGPPRRTGGGRTYRMSFLTKGGAQLSPAAAFPCRFIRRYA